MKVINFCNGHDTSKPSQDCQGYVHHSMHSGNNSINVAMTFINDRTLGDLVNTKHCNTIEKLNVLEGYSSKNINFNSRNARSCTYRLIILLSEDGSDSWK